MKSSTGTPPLAARARVWAGDVLPSIVVFLVALPLCMGIAIASGMPPALGLITGMIGGLVVGVLAGSPLQVSGPAAGLAVIVYELVQTHGLAAIGVIVLLAGVIQLVAGLLKAGRWFQAVPPSVIYGMLAGIGVLIFSSQFHLMVDDKPRGSGVANLLAIPQAIWKGLAPTEGSVHHLAGAIGLLTVVVMLLWGRFAPGKLKLLPAPLIAVVAATVASLGLGIARVPVPDDLFAAANVPPVTAWQQLLDPAILVAALTLAVVASAETLLCASAVDRLHDGERTNHDRELAAQGVGNILCGALGALPMTGVIVRSSANVQAGAKTRASAVLHGAWLLLLVLAAPFVLRLIPVASLAAILVVTGYKLVNPAAVRQLARHSRSEVLIWAATVIGIVSMDLLKGVVLGLVLAAAKVLVNLSRLGIRLEREGERVALHLSGDATFLRLPLLTSALSAVPAGTTVQVRLERLDSIDLACIDALGDWEKQHRARGGSAHIDWELVRARSRGPREELQSGAELSALRQMEAAGS